METETTFELTRTAKKFGASCHIIIPKCYLGRTITCRLRDPYDATDNTLPPDTEPQAGPGDQTVETSD